jgi:uncharacterized alkaline shock family protein YloU
MANSFRYGSVKIANETLEVIAKTSAEEVKGVYKSFDDVFGKKNDVEAKVFVNNSILTVDLVLVLMGNLDVRRTVKKIQENVKRQLEVMTGLKVDRVNVSISKLII